MFGQVGCPQPIAAGRDALATLSRERLVRVLPLLASALLCAAAHAQALDPAPDLTQLATMPGAEVTRDANGVVQAVTLNRSGVVITSVRQGDGSQTTGVDNSGHGAVLCLLSIYIETRTTLDVCFPDQYADLHRELDGAIGKTLNFVVANSLAPVAMPALQAGIAARETMAKTQAAKLGPERVAAACAKPNGAGQMVTAMSQQSAADWQKSVADLLSVPRPPVMNPCL